MQRTKAMLAGIVIGLSLVGYASNRILVPIAFCYIAFGLLHLVRNSDQTWSHRARSELEVIGSVAIGFFVTSAPMIGHFRGNDESLMSRTNQVSIFTTGWLDSESELLQVSKLHLIGDQTVKVLKLPFGNISAGTFFHPDPPLFGLILGLALGIGVTMMTLKWWSRSYFGLMATFWGTSAAMVLTVGPNETSRFATVIAIVPLIGAAGDRRRCPDCGVPIASQAIGYNVLRGSRRHRHSVFKRHLLFQRSGPV